MYLENNYVYLLSCRVSSSEIYEYLRNTVPCVPEIIVSIRYNRRAYSNHSLSREEGRRATSLVFKSFFFFFSKH